MNNLLTNPIVLVAVLLGCVAAMYGSQVLLTVQDKTKNVSGKVTSNPALMSKLTALGVIILTINAVLYLAMFYIGFYFVDGELPAFRLYPPIIIFLAFVNVLVWAVYRLGHDKENAGQVTEGTDPVSESPSSEEKEVT